MIASARRCCVRLAFAVCASLPSLAAAQDSPRWYFQTSYYTRHYSPDPRHLNDQRLVNFERLIGNDNLYGAAFFDNSFNQPSQYVYVGRRWRPFESAEIVHVKLTAGVLHGYKGEFQDKIPFNGRGIAPAILPAVGISGNRFATEVVLFWTAGAMFTAGVFWD
jgi:hypothetical protein